MGSSRGFIKPGEDFSTSLKREIREELGCEIEVGQILDALPVDYLYQGINVPVLGITALATIISGIIKPGDDVSDYKFFTVQEALEQEFGFECIREMIKRIP